jgi:hypothetical protein
MAVDEAVGLPKQPLQLGASLNRHLARLVIYDGNQDRRVARYML